MLSRHNDLILELIPLQVKKTNFLTREVADKTSANPDVIRHHVLVRNTVRRPLSAVPASCFSHCEFLWENVYFPQRSFFQTHEESGKRSVRGGSSRAATAAAMLFSQLPDDVLYHILSYLDYRSLSRLSQVCKSTYHFINRDVVWRRVAKDFLNTGITRNGTDM